MSKVAKTILAGLETVMFAAAFLVQWVMGLLFIGIVTYVFFNA